MRFYTATNIDAAILSVKTDGEKHQNKIHRVLASAVKMCHDDQYRARNKPDDLIAIGALFANRINAIMENAPWHRQSIGVWVEKLTPLKFSEENNRFYAPAPDGEQMCISGRLFPNQAAMRTPIDNPFWTVAPPKAAYKPLTVEKQIDMLNAYLTAQSKHAKKPHKEDNYSDQANSLIREAIQILQAI